MFCEVCGGLTTWRSTNTLTGVAKYKCKECGHITKALKTNFDDPIVDKGVLEKCPQHPNSNCYYDKRHDTYGVRKMIDHKDFYFGQYPSWEMAQAVIDKLIEYEWDKNALPRIHAELGIVRDGRRYVWT